MLDTQREEKASPQRPVDSPSNEGMPREETALERSERRRAGRLASVGFAVETLLAVAVVALVLVGMIGLLEAMVAAAGAVVAFAAGLLVESRTRRLAARARVRELGLAEVGAFSAEYLAGGPAIILGILALNGIVPEVLVAVAMLLFGVMLMFGGTEAGRQANMHSVDQPLSPSERRIRRVLEAVAGCQMLAGITAVILGIMALVGSGPARSILIGLLVLGVSKLLGTATVSWRMKSLDE